jgi:hypothetical protein
VAARARVDPVFALELDKLNHLSAADKARFHPHRAWAAPDIARRPRLLFVADRNTETVDVFSMPNLVRVGQETGFTSLGGLCSDPRTGDIWVVDSGANEIVRLSRTLHISSHLADRNYTAGGCAVDPTTGNLAVANQFGPGFTPGNVSIFVHGHGDAEPITDPNLELYIFPGYDTSGDLWVTGLSPAGTPEVSSCTFPTGCSTLSLSGATLSGSLTFVTFTTGQRSWYIGDDDCAGSIPAHMCAYPVSSSLVLGTPITFVDTNGQTVCYMSDPAITAHMSRVLVGGTLNEFCGGVNSVARWSFPGGGTATHGNPAVGIPVSAAISMR